MKLVTRDEKGRVSFGKAEIAIQALIVANLAFFAIETLPGLSEATMRFLKIAEIISVSIFSAEYLARLFLSRPRFTYVFSFFGIIDLLAILPFFIGLGVDLRSVRAFRLLRLIRTLKMARYSAAMQRFHRAFLIAKEELVLFGVVATILLYFTAVGIYYFENPAQPEVFASVFHSLWWALVTLTTVGYGDSYPITVGGKVFTALILVVGLGIVAVPTGIFASALSKAREEE